MANAVYSEPIVGDKTCEQTEINPQWIPDGHRWSWS